MRRVDENIRDEGGESVGFLKTKLFDELFETIIFGLEVVEGLFVLSSELLLI